MWTIEVDYTTGSSFHTEEITGESIGPCWKRKEDAIAALNEIREYTEYLELTENRWYYGPLTKKQQDARVKELKKRDWYCKTEYNSVVLKLKHDDGERKYQSAFWAGYFETLHEARVVAVGDGDECVFRPN